MAINPWTLPASAYKQLVELELRSVTATEEGQQAERTRCFINSTTSRSAGFQYWAARHWHLADRAGKCVLLRLNAMQRSYLADRLDENVILKARKPGASTVVDALYYWRARQRPNQRAYIMAHQNDSAAELWARVKYAHDRMRPWLAAPLRYSTRRELDFQDNDSRLAVLTAGGHEAGRAGDADAVHLSECAHYRDLKSVEAAVGEAMRPNAWLDFESTPAGVNRFEEVYRQARDGETASRRAHFFTWYSQPEKIIRLDRHAAAELEQDLDPTELLLLDGQAMRQRPRHSQLEAIAWRRERKAKLGNLFEQEHAEDDTGCFLAAGAPLFDAQHLRQLLQAVTDRVDVLAPQPGDPYGATSDGNRLEVYVRPRPGRRYVIGCDVAEGLAGRAYSVAAVLDITAEYPEQVAEWHGHVNPYSFGKFTLPELGRFYNGALVGPERNNHGHATLAGLREAGYSPIYKHRHLDQRAKGTTKRPGWPTDSRTKPIMLSDLRECLGQGFMVVRSAGFIRECMAMQANEPDRDDEDAPSGGAWRDRVMAWAIAWQLRKLTMPAAVG